MNCASSAAVLVFYLPVVCTHTDTEGKQRKDRVHTLYILVHDPIKLYKFDIQSLNRAFTQIVDFPSCNSLRSTMHLAFPLSCATTLNKNLFTMYVNLITNIYPTHLSCEKDHVKKARTHGETML